MSEDEAEAEDEDEAEDESAGIGLTMVLLSRDDVTLDAAAIAAAHRELSPRAPALEEGWGDDGEPLEVEREGEATFIRFGDGQGRAALMVMPPIPGGEAEKARELSIAALRDLPPMEPQRAHVLVTLVGAPPGLDGLLRLTWLTAAVTKATGGHAVHWGAAPVTHDAEFFLDVTKGLGPDDVPIMLWLGMSVAGGDGGRTLLSWGMEAQLGIEELLLEVGAFDPPEALEFFFDLLLYAARRGAAVPAGETVGRTAGEKLAVRAAPHPVDPQRTVWAVDLSGAEPASGGGGACLVLLALLIAGAAGVWFMFLR